ncbi:hypothetical protein PWT90_02245 [Aphanocladium album]|nr:hypothetical protein PWT90_02245 [Aphanocladium album]
MAQEQPKLYPLHPSQEAGLNAEYKAFYNKDLIATPRVYTLPIDVIRSLPQRPFPGSAPEIPVGKRESIPITPDSGPAKGVTIPTRCYTPSGSAPSGGWPVVVYYHGGGWTLGGLDLGADAQTNICERANIVINRLAPEHVFPAAVDDAWAALLWVASAAGKERLNINLENLAVAGDSAGGNLAAVMAQRAVTRGGPLIKTQLLDIPVMDNTATVDNNPCWREQQHAPSLPAEQMMWFRNFYLPNEADWSHPDASPLLWAGDWSKLPPAVMIVAGMDVLRDEGEAFGAKLKQAGVNVQVTTFADQTHTFPVMSGALESGRRAITIMCDSLRDAFYNKNSIFARSNI